MNKLLQKASLPTAGRKETGYKSTKTEELNPFVIQTLLNINHLGG